MPGAEARDPRDVHSLLGFGHRASENHVVHLGGIDSRRPAKGVGDDRGGEVVRTRPAQRARAGFADRGANGRNDNSVFHNDVRQD